MAALTVACLVALFVVALVICLRAWIRCQLERDEEGDE